MFIVSIDCFAPRCRATWGPMLNWLNGRLREIAIFLSRCLEGFLEWLFASQNPVVVSVREAARRNRVLTSAAWAFIRAVRGLPMLMHKFWERQNEFWELREIRRKMKPLPVRRMQSIMMARAVGGSLTTAELERIWVLARPTARVRVVAEGLELEQILIVLNALAARVTAYSSLVAYETANLETEAFDLTVVAPVPGLAKEIARLQDKEIKPERFI